MVWYGCFDGAPDCKHTPVGCLAIEHMQWGGDTLEVSLACRWAQRLQTGGWPTLHIPC
jgi:hypothetical protein